MIQVSPQLFLAPVVLLATTVLLAAPAHGQSTWVVDDDPGPGVHFGEIQDALFASSDGDLILVRDGAYSGFVVRSAVRILGEGTVRVIGTGEVRGVQSPSPVILAGIRVDDFEVVDCSATVTLVDSLIIRTLEIAGSSDVRMHAVTVRESTEVDSSRAEFLRCDLRGAIGQPGGGSCDDGESGTTAVVVLQSSAHFALTDMKGGDGGVGTGTGCLTTCNGYGGSGGHGLLALGSDIVITGDGTQRVEAGYGGWSSCFSFDGTSGYGANVQNSELRYSGVTFISSPGRELITWGSQVTTPAADPAVEVTGSSSPGSQVNILVRGNPGDHARLNLGRAPTVVDVPGSAIGRLVTYGRSISLGPLPANGLTTLPITIPTSYPPGTALWLQASAVDSVTGLGQSSNSAVLLVR